jgi:hypothetical protein
MLASADVGGDQGSGGQMSIYLTLNTFMFLRLFALSHSVSWRMITSDLAQRMVSVSAGVLKSNSD